MLADYPSFRKSPIATCRNFCCRCNVPFEEATLLKLNCDKALAYLHWHSTLHYDECVNFIAEWYRAFYVEQAKDMFALTEKQINAYMEAAKKQNLDWAK